MRTSFVIALLFSGCLAPPPAVGPKDGGVDASQAFELVTADVTTRSGETRAWTNVPCRAQARLTFSHSVVNALESILLLRGDVDESTRADLESLPLRADTLARVVVTHVQAAETVVSVTPAAPLARGETYSLVVTPFSRTAGDMELDGSVRVFPMRVSTHEDDGAMLLETWPADGTNEVPVDLLLALLRFDGSVQDLDLGVGLRADSGYLVPRSVHKVDCTAYGFGEGMCVIVAPTDALDAGREYELYVNESLRDGTGASFEPSRVTFRTAQFGSAPEPEFVAPPCAIDEAALPFGCALSDDDGSFFAPTHAFRCAHGSLSEACPMMRPQRGATLRSSYDPCLPAHLFSHACAPLILQAASS